MQVVDASVLVEAMRLDGPLADESVAVARRLGSIAPELIDIEVLQTLRRLVRTGALGPAEALIAIDGLSKIPLTRRPHLPLIPRIWELRDNLTAYDAAYVALAEALRCPLVTSDARLASAPGIRCEVEVIGA